MHELTEKIKKVKENHPWLWQDCDRTIREWLDEKTKEVRDNYAAGITEKTLKQILGLANKSLEDKFMEYTDGKILPMTVGNKVSYLDFMIFLKERDSELAEVAKQYFKDNPEELDD